MKRITTLGLSLLAVLALGAIASSAAFAENAEIGRCFKAGKEEVKYTEGGKEKHKEVYTGAFSDKACLEAAPAGVHRAEGKPEGKYEYAAGAAKNGNASATGKATLTGSSGVIECKKSTGAGEYLSPELGVTQVEFTECSTKKDQCTTTRKNGEGNYEEVGTKGDILTYTLGTKLAGDGEKFVQLSPVGTPEGEVGPGAGEAWTMIQSAGLEGNEGIQATYNCAGVAEIWTEGALGGPTTKTDKMSATASILFEEGKGLQDLFSSAQGKAVEEAGGGTGRVPIGRGIEKTKAKVTNEEKLEIRT
jgi:hypothetical protein